MKRRLIGYVGDKGGCGKSLTACAHAQVLRSRGYMPYLVDCDGEVGHLARMYGARDEAGKLLREQPADGGVRRFRFHGSERDRVEFADVLDQGRDLVLVDLPAASITLLRAIEADYGFFRIAHEAGYDVTLVIVVTPDEASLASVRGAADLDPHADLVMIRNAAFGDSEDYVVWDGSEREGIAPARGKALLAERHGYDLTLPLLNRGTVALLSARKMSFAQAAAMNSPLHSGRRSQVDTWLRKVDAELHRAGEVMGFDGVA